MRRPVRPDDATRRDDTRRGDATRRNKRDDMLTNKPRFAALPRKAAS